MKLVNIKRCVSFWFLFFFIILACKKSEKNDGGVPVKPTGGDYPNETTLNLTVDSANSVPGELLTLTASKVITRDTCTVKLGSEIVLLNKVDSVHYVFLVPVLKAGSYTLDLKKLNAKQNPQVNIRDYPEILDPDQAISAAINKYNSVVDSLVKNSYKNAVTAADGDFMHQIMDQLSQNAHQCSVNEKLKLAYQLQNMGLYDKKSQNSTKIKVQSLKTQSDENEVGYILTLKAIEASRAFVKALIASAALVYVGDAAATPPPDIYRTVAFLAALGNFVLEVKSARNATAVAIDYAGKADSLVEVNGTGGNLKPVTVSVGTILSESWEGARRTFKKSDETAEMNDGISQFFEKLQDLVTKDSGIKTMFDNLRRKVSQFFPNLTLNYIPFTDPLPQVAREETGLFDAQYITVSAVSNPDITVTAKPDGGNRLKLTFDNPSKNITKSTDFTFQITYNQASINNKVTITEYGKFSPQSVPIVTTTIVGTIAQTSATSGGIITSDGGSPIVSKGLCFATTPNPVPDITNTILAGDGQGSFVSKLTNLKPNTIYHVRAFASNGVGMGYGNDLSFTTSKNIYTLILNSPDPQSGVTKTKLNAPISVKVLDENNNVVKNASISWNVIVGGGAVSTLSSVTDLTGVASNQWTLGSQVGNQTCSATLSPIDGTTIMGSPVIFTAIAKQGTVLNLALMSTSNNQIGYPNHVLDRPLQVLVTDQNNKPVNGITINFQVSSGGGSLASTVPTNTAGIASAIWTLGNSGAQSVVVKAKNPDGSNANGTGLSFNATFDNSTISIKGATYSWVRGRYGAPVPGNINYASPNNPPYYVYEPGQELAFGETLTVTAIGIPPAPNSSAGGYSYTVGSYQPDSLFISPGPGSNATNSYGHQFPEGWGWKLPPGYELKMYIYVGGQLVDNNIPSRISKDGLYIYRGYGGDMVYKKK
ncbi:MAG TPA: Ig-like domain-containing protein [Mucilaginibacter sp.]|jgi:hypothetical protein|nr:Ig-like domain-containing protein [Mucilaginibacter sp.]